MPPLFFVKILNYTCKPFASIMIISAPVRAVGVWPIQDQTATSKDVTYAEDVIILTKGLHM